MQNKILSKVVVAICVVSGLVSQAHAASWTKLECQAVPNTGSSSYNTNIQCVAQIARPGAARWYNAYRQYCPTFCASIGGVNVPSPDGFSCTSGEERPWSAINAGVDYRPTGCWHSCSQPEGSPGAKSESFRCYHPSQKRDNDRTDTTVGCFCATGDTGASTIEVGIHSHSTGGAKVRGVSISLAGWGRVDRSLVNDQTTRIFDVLGEIPLGGTGTLSMNVNVQGACGTSAVINGNIAHSYGAQVPSPNVTVQLPPCAPQCSDGIDNDGDGAIDLADAGCQNDPRRNDERDAVSGQCSDGIDNDNDGKTDALVTNSPQLQVTQTFGGAGDPMLIATLVSNAIASKKLPFTRPTAPLVRTDGGTWDAGTPHLPTLNQVCRILGFSTYVSSTCRDDERSGRYPNGKCNYHSPEDNQHFRFNGANFAAECAMPKYGKTWIASITCAGPLAACSDGVDNDGDGKVDLNDDGCASANDTDERPHDPQCATPSSPSEFSQCNDSKDNDSDGLVDRADPGCWTDASNPNTYDSNRDNEGADTTQCQDGKDNDADGATDYPNDFSCSSKQDNDEANPKSQCQNGTDDDNDGLVDALDPGCSSNQDNNESDGTSQCQDGKDNDADGATDYPADFSCANAGDNDEANPKSQCQNGADDDNDGLVDTLDPGCSSNQDNNEADATTQCQDGQDNDADGATDYPADFSCSSKLDTDEANPKSQCQNGADDDNDGLVDALDPGCSSNQDNNESDGTSQCQDGQDNDADGATDYPADFSCSSKQDNDEANPKSQCQNGTDDDNDGLIDAKDPGCSTPQDNNESDSTSQCQDGKDNDADGLIDAKDPGCSTPQDNDESDGTSQCQDTKDNDADGLIDAKDPGCSTPQDNDESDGTSQCQDTKDNDADGLIDAKDPGCSSPQDNDESDGTAQCQDTKDNDADGLIDLKDPGCSSAQDNDESDGTSQCQDTKDNDADGLIDAKDPGCSTPQDNDESDGTAQCQDTKDNDADGLIDAKDPGCSTPQDNDESDEAALLTVGVECLTVNADGSRTAYFSYNNTTGADLSVTTNSNLGTVNEFATTGSSTPPPTAFKAGLAKGAVVVTFTGDSLTWLVRAQKSAASRATASATTPVCAPVTPKAECRGYQNGVLTVRMGYVNGNSFEQQVPVGPSNGFAPGAVDRGQPNRFFAGTNKSVFQVSLASTTDSFTWGVNGTSVKVDNTIPVCDGECVDTPTGNVTAELDAIAQQLSDVMTRAANILASAKATSGKATTRNRTDAERAKKKAQDYTAQAKILTIQFPNVIKTCPQAPAYCETVDRQYAIESLKGLYANQRNSTQRTIARAYFRNTGKTSRSDSLVKQAKDLEQQGLAALAKLPRFETQCK